MEDREKSVGKTYAEQCMDKMHQLFKVVEQLQTPEGQAKFDKVIEEECRRIKEEQIKLWNASIQKWRGLSIEEYSSIDLRYGIVDLFKVGAEVFFVQDDVIQSGLIDKITIFINENEGGVRYDINKAKNRIESSFVFASADEAKEHLRLGIVNPKGYGKGYGLSDFKTTVEDIQRTGYSVVKLDTLRLGTEKWIMKNNVPTRLPITCAFVEIAANGTSVKYKLGYPDPYDTYNIRDCNSEYYTVEQLFSKKEELIDSL